MHFTLLTGVRHISIVNSGVREAYAHVYHLV